MLDWIRDPLWQFVGSLLAFIGILVSIYLFTVQRRVKSLAYDVIVQTPLLTVSEEMQGKIKILFDEKPVPNIYLLILKIFNDGNAAIATSDFEKPLKFYFGKDATILSAEVTKTTPDTFKPEVTFQPQHLEISPTLFNAGDLAIVKLLISQHDGSIKPDARIVGVRGVRKWVAPALSISKVAIPAIAIGILMLPLGNLLLYGSIIPPYNPLDPTQPPQSPHPLFWVFLIPLAIGMALFITASVLSIRRLSEIENLSKSGN